jgi:hypothetical protein
MTPKAIMILAVVIILIAAGVFTVVAQQGDDDTPPFGPGMMHGGQGSMMQHGFGSGMMGADEGSMMAGVAEVLGLEPEALVDALHNGQTLTEIAEAQGVELQSVYDAILAQAEEHMAASVAAGNLTQEQADEHLGWMREHIAEMPKFSGEGFGDCMGHHDGGHGMGMMRQGHGMGWNSL